MVSGAVFVAEAFLVWLPGAGDAAREGFARVRRRAKMKETQRLGLSMRRKGVEVSGLGLERGDLRGLLKPMLCT